MARWEEARLLRDCWQPEPELGPPAKPCKLRPVSPKPEGAGEEESNDEPGAPRDGINNLFVLICGVGDHVPSWTGLAENPGGGLVLLARQPARSLLEEDLSSVARDWKDGLTDFSWALGS